jgi:hypothetical protein
MAAAFLVALAALLFEDDNLFVLLVFEDSGFDRRSLYERASEASIRSFTDHEDFIDVDRVACFRIRERVNFEDIAFSYSKLATLCFDSGFHWKNGRAKRCGTFNQEFSGLFLSYFKAI